MRVSRWCVYEPYPLPEPVRVSGLSDGTLASASSISNEMPTNCRLTNLKIISSADMTYSLS
jgi:hypothetical protein